MRTLLRPSIFLLLAASLVLTMCLTANADRVAVSGYADMGDLNLDLNVRAGLLSAYWTAPDDVGPSSIGFGTVGIPMTLSFGFGGFLAGTDFVQVHIGNQFTDIADPSFLFKSSLFTVSTIELANGTITIPVTVSGELLAYQDLTLGQGSSLPGSLIAALQFAGKGTATLDLVDENLGTFQIQSAHVEFNNIHGTLTTVPEPTSLLVFGTGLSGLALIWRSRRNVAHSGRMKKSNHGPD